MSQRHETIGIKQSIRIEWMQKVVNLLLAGLDAKSIRIELHEFLSDRKGNGTVGERSDMTRTFVVNNLMSIWVSPNSELIPFRDASLVYLRDNPSMVIAVHWGMISAVYPFWFNVARQIGRLLALQDQVTQMQIISRVIEQFGDRQTISRYARYVIRSLVSWGVLEDLEEKGCYKKANPVIIVDLKLVSLMLEAALLASPDAKGTLGLLLNNPAFFPFQFPVISGDSVSQHSERIEVVRYGLDDELLSLKVR